MKKAVVTGVTSGIGYEIGKRLIARGYFVYGIGRDFSKNKIEDKNFCPIICDLTKYQNIEEMGRKLKGEDIEILVNCAGVGYFAPHEEINPTKIHKLISLNLEAPLVLTQIFLRNLKKNGGWIINISSITATKPSPQGCAYSATKAGLVHFSRGLFEEVRKYGVKVVSILPDITKTPFYDSLNFREGEEEDSYILPEDIGEVVENLLSQRDGIVTREVVISPQKHRIRKK